MGVELDFIYKILRNLDFQGLFSFGDWTWDKEVSGLQFYNYDTDQPVNKVIDFDATGIHVGDAAQFQLGANLRYEPFDGLYLNGRITHFGKYYSDFTPESTTDELGNPVDSWKIPDYQMVDFHAGYRFGIKTVEKVQFYLNLSVLNLLNAKYITDAVNNDPYNSLPFADFDAKSATVFFGMGRRFITSLQISF
jgi:iron complex outermembrane receptor protein